MPRPDQTTNYAVSTVSVSGVSDTKSREHDWQAAATIAFTAVPAAIVTDVGAVAEENGAVKVPRTSSRRVAHPEAPHGTYEMAPTIWIVATYWPSPTAEYSTSVNVGENSGVTSLQTAAQSLCSMVARPK